jgi:hypothetical protein
MERDFYDLLLMQATEQSILPVISLTSKFIEESP